MICDVRPRVDPSWAVPRPEVHAHAHDLDRVRAVCFRAIPRRRRAARAVPCALRAALAGVDVVS